MFKNYFKIAFRSFSFNKLYSFINISGLAIGIAACALIYFWVQDELSYDQFHENAERIYRLERSWDFKEMHGQAPLAAGPWGPALVRDYPEIENTVRLENAEMYLKDHRNMFRKQKLFVADNSIFEVFDFRLQEGDKNSALTEPYTAVIARDYALKYLGVEDALGKTLTVDWQGAPVDFKITGILEEVPTNSHIRFDVLLSLASYPPGEINQWFGKQLYTYLLLAEGTSLQNLKDKFPAFLQTYVAEEFLGYFGPDLAVTDVFQVQLKPLLDIHLLPGREWEIEPPGSMTTVYIFSIVAALILLIACINFTNLTTARAKKRAKEVGLRKTVGANKKQLLQQFFGESIFMAGLASVFAMSLISFFLPVFNEITGKTVSPHLLYQTGNWLLLLAITLGTGLIAGLFPALFLSNFEPIRALKGNVQTGSGKSTFRRTMAVIQFAISITIIIGTITVYQQMVFLQNKELGFDKENIITLAAESNNVRSNVKTFRDALLSDARIKSVSASSNVPGTKVLGDTNFRRKDTDDTYNLILLKSDYDFFETYGVDLVSGREFSKERGMDAKGGFILNERAVQTIGCTTAEEAIGKELVMTVGPDQIQEGQIVGVVKGFHLQSLHLKIQPMLFLIAEPEDITAISVKINPGNFSQTVEFIHEKWQELFPGEVFEFNFLDNNLKLLYQSEQQLQKVFFLFSLLSIFIACLGLFGLAAFTAEERTKEIGIRKVLGASSIKIVVSLLREFSVWVLIAGSVASPIAWIVMNGWLQNFAYQIKMDWWVFLLASGVTLVVALLTVSWQAARAATANPVESLRCE